MKKWPFLFFLLSHPLFATLSIPFTMDIGEGYREDHLKLHLELPATPGTSYEERYDPLRFAQTEITFRTVQRDIYLLGNFGYGAFGTTRAKQGPFYLSFASDANPTFHFDTTADAFNAMGIFGYQVDLTPGRHYTVAFTPLFGYSWYYDQIRRKGTSPHPLTGSFGVGETYSMTSNVSNKDLTTQWNGFFIGADLQIYPGGRVTFNVMYAYHFMSLRQTIQFSNDVQTFSSGVLASDIETQWKVKVKTSGNHGHLGILKAEYAFSQHWGGILFGKILYFSSHTRNVTVKEQIKNIFPAAPEVSIRSIKPYKLTHVIFELLLEVSYKW